MTRPRMAVVVVAAPLFVACVPDAYPENTGASGGSTTTTGGTGGAGASSSSGGGSTGGHSSSGGTGGIGGTGGGGTGGTGTGGSGGSSGSSGSGGSTGGSSGSGGGTGGGGTGGAGGTGGSGGTGTGGGQCDPLGGTEAWSRGFPGDGSDRARYVAVDAESNVIVAGDFATNIDLGEGSVLTKGSLDAFVAKRSPAGEPIWSRIFGDAQEQYVQGVAVDASGNVAVAGAFYGTLDFGAAGSMTASFVDGWVVKLDAAGQPLWAKQIQGAGADEASGVAFDAAGNLYVTGELDGTVNLGGDPLVSAGSYDAFIVKYDPNGNHLWSKRFGDAATQHAYHLAVDATGVVFTGYANGAMDFGGGTIPSAGGEDVFAAKLDPSGNHLWGKLYGDSATIQRGQRVATDGAGNTYLVGWYSGSLDFGAGPLVSMGTWDGFLVKLDSGGNHVWSKHYSTAGEEAAYGVAVAPSGEIAVTGPFNTALDLGGGLLTATGHDAFVVLYDEQGNHLWSRRAGDPAEQVPHAVAIDPAGDIVLAGHFFGSMDWGDGTPITSAGSGDAWIAKLHGCR